MGWTVAEAVKATGGRLLQGNPDAPLTGFSTDTRSIEAGSCFVALLGERHDGHDHIGDAMSRGGAALVVQEDKLQSMAALAVHVPVIEVTDTLVALGDLAKHHRSRFGIPLVGITGSNGKTSTKEMVAAVLARRNRVLKNSGNFNNLIGVPLTLLALGPEHRAAVVEMGINVPGEMARLVDVARPTVGLITNVHPAHLEGLHSLDLVLSEKGKLWEGIGPGGLAVVNNDDERLKELARRLRCRTVTYSIRDASADVALTGPVEMDQGGSSFRVTLGGKVVPVRFSVLGEHHVSNALAAAAVAWGMGEPVEAIEEGLSVHKPVRQRMEMHRLSDGRVLVDDTYNANPRSMVAAVQAVRKASRGSPVVLVLGDMKELGPESASLHRDVGSRIGALGVEGLITLGELSKEIAAGALEAGVPSESCSHAASHDEAVEILSKRTVPGQWILVKGSRSMTMEKVVEGFMKNNPP